MFLDEEKLDDLISECQQSGNFSTLKQTLWDVFSSPESLGRDAHGIFRTFRTKVSV